MYYEMSKERKSRYLEKMTVRDKNYGAAGVTGPDLAQRLGHIIPAPEGVPAGYHPRVWKFPGWVEPIGRNCRNLGIG